MTRQDGEHLLIVGAGDGGPSFVLTDMDGAFLGRGAFPEEATPGHIVVIGDYGLLHRGDLPAFTLADAVGLIAPEPALGPDDVARIWVGTTPENREYLHLAELADIEPIIDARADLDLRTEAILLRARARLSAISPEYRDLLSADGDFIRELLPVLREYPTPQRLRAAAHVQLPRVLRAALPQVAMRDVIDRLVEFARTAPGAGDRGSDIDEWLAESLIPGDVDLYQTTLRQRAELDRRLFGFVRQLRRHGVPADKERPRPVARIRPLPHSRFRCESPSRLLARAELLLAKRENLQRRPDADFRELQQIRAAFAATAEPDDAAMAMRIETIGQLLALSAGRFLDAIRHLAACESQLAALAQVEDPAAFTTSEQWRADAVLASALTRAIVVDALGDVQHLRSAVESDLASHASTAMRNEALGLVALQMMLVADHMDQPQTLRAIRSSLASASGQGSTRAPADIAEYFIISARPDVCPDLLAQAAAAADENSRGTVYRYWFLYVQLLASCVTKDFERGIRSYAEITAEAIWPGISSRVKGTITLAYVLHLAAAGDLAGARRELAALRDVAERSGDGVMGLIHGFTQLRLDLASGEHRKVLAATMPDGPLGEDAISGPHVRRYLPSTLILRGTALAREGDTKLAVECFVRATHQAVMVDEWYSVLATETHEYRAWLESLDRDDLPIGLGVELYDALLRRPVFIQVELPRLTPRQMAILRLLARGRSVHSIAAELHVTENTMKSHLRRIYRRLGVHSRDQAVLRADAYGLLD